MENNNNEAPNENPAPSNSSSSDVPIVEIYISLPFASSEMEIHCSCHNGFSIRAYAASKRGSNPDVSSVHPSMGGSDGRGFPPMNVPPSRYWRCSRCSCVRTEEEVVAPAGAQEGVAADHMDEMIPPAEPNVGAPEQGLPDANEEIRGAANSDGMQGSPRASTTSVGVDVNADAAVEISILPSPSTPKVADPTVTDTDAVEMSISPSPSSPKTAAADTGAVEVSMLPSPSTPKSAPPIDTDAGAFEISTLPSPSTPKFAPPTVVEATFIGVAEVPAEDLNADAIDLQNQSLENTAKDAAGKQNTPETDSSQEHSKKRRHRSLADILGGERASAGRKAVSEVQPSQKRNRASWKDKGKAKVTEEDDSDEVLLPPRGEGLFIGSKEERTRNRSGFVPPLRRKKAKQTLAFDLSKKVAELIQSLPAPPAVRTLESQQQDQNHAGLSSHSRLTELSQLDLNLSLGCSSKAYHNQKRGGKGIRKRNGTQRCKKGLLDLNKTAATIPLQEKKDFLRLGPKESDQSGSDDIPMDIVELLAKKQHERENPDAVFSPVVHGSSDIPAEGASPSAPHLRLAPAEEDQSQGLPTFGLAPYPAASGRAGLFPPPFNFGSGGLLNQQGQQQKGKTISDIKADEWRKTAGAARFCFTKPGTSASASRASAVQALQLMSLMDGRSGTGLSLGSTRAPSRPPRDDWNGLLTGSMFSGQLHLKDPTPNPSASFQSLRPPSAALSGHITFSTPELLQKAGSSSTGTGIFPGSDPYIPYLHAPGVRAGSLAQRFLRPGDSNRAVSEAITVPFLPGVVRTGRNVSADGVCRTNRNPAEFSVPEPGNMYTLSSRDLNTRKRKPYKKRTPGEKAADQDGAKKRKPPSG